MTKERLNNLIKQRGFVYATKDNKIIKINLETCIIDDNLLLVGYDFCFDDCEDCYDISRLFETKEQAEWALKTVAERTERFEPPMWDELKDHYRFSFFNASGHVVELFVANYKSVKHIVVFEQGETEGYLFDGELAKENYEKACEIVRDLFKGEK